MPYWQSKIYIYFILLSKKIQIIHQDLIRMDKVIHFMWIPSHKKILANEVADRLAKNGANKSTYDFIELCYEDIKLFSKNLILKNWENKWEKMENNFLKRIKPNITPLLKHKYNNRREQTIIGHCFFSHGFLINREAPPWCITCDRRIDVSHILVDYPLYNTNRLKYKLENKIIRDILSDMDCN